jgi:heme-degrading monooxygenase HmoA
VYVRIWSFEIKNESKARFEEVYGPAGDWAQLFQRAPGYVRTELLKDRGLAGRYLTCDYWQSQDAYRAFEAQWKKEFDTLDRECEAMTLRETCIGEFDLIA